VPFGASSYAANSMVFSPDGHPQGKTRLAEITDGTSSTILYAEKYARCFTPALPPRLGDGGAAWAYLSPSVFSWLPPPLNLPVRGFPPAFAIAACADIGAPDVIGPRSKFQVQPTPGNCDPTRASTAHAGGMEVGMADGSVRTLSSGMSPTTWWAVVTPKG